MKRFVVGVVVGLVLASAPTIAEWSFSDAQKLEGIGGSVAFVARQLKRIADAQERQTGSVEWSARSLERITKAQEKIANCCTCPAERAK